MTKQKTHYEQQEPSTPAKMKIQQQQNNNKRQTVSNET